MAIAVYTTLMSSAATIPRTVTCSHHSGMRSAAGSDSMSGAAVSCVVLWISLDAPRSWLSISAPVKTLGASNSSSSKAAAAMATTLRG